MDFNKSQFPLICTYTHIQTYFNSNKLSSRRGIFSNQEHRHEYQVKNYKSMRGVLCYTGERQRQFGKIEGKSRWQLKISDGKES